MKLGKILLFGGGAWLLLKAFGKGSGYAHFYDKMNYYINVKLHSVKFNGITLKADIEIHNPVDVALTITKPTLRVYANDVEIGHSTPEDVKVPIAPRSVTKIPTITILLPWSLELGKLITAAGKRASDLIASGSNQEIGIRVTTKALFNVDGINDITQTTETVI